MENLIELVLTGENLRTLLLLVVIIGGFLLQNAQMGKRFVEVRSELKADIARVDAKVDKGFVEVDKRFIEVQAKLESEIAAVRADLSGEIAGLRGEIAAVRADLSGEIAAVRADLSGEIAGLRGEIVHLKDNDFAHLSNAFRNLTYVLEKKKLIDAEDKAFIDKALDG